MLLSEAIRLGAALGPQLFGKLRDEQGGTCAIGAAIEAAGLKANIETLKWQPLHDVFPILTVTVACPFGDHGCYQTTGPLGTMILHWNDTHRCTREQIANWVSQLERTVPAEFIDAVARTGDLITV